MLPDGLAASLRARLEIRRRTRGGAARLAASSRNLRQPHGERPGRAANAEIRGFSDWKERGVWAAGAAHVRRAENHGLENAGFVCHGGAEPIGGVP